MTEAEAAGWHHRHTGRDSEQAPGGGEGQGGLARCSPRGHRESGVTERQQQATFKQEGSGDHSFHAD